MLLMETRHLARRLTRIENGLASSHPDSQSTLPGMPKHTKRDSMHHGGLVLQVNDGGKVQVNQALREPSALQDRASSTSTSLVNLEDLKIFLTQHLGVVQSQIGNLEGQIHVMQTQTQSRMQELGDQIRNLDRKIDKASNGGFFLELGDQ